METNTEFENPFFRIHDIFENPKDYTDVDTTRWGFDDEILASSRDPSEAEPMVALVRLYRDEAGDFCLRDNNCVMPMVDTSTLQTFVQGRRNNPYFQDLLTVRAFGENAGWIGEEENALCALRKAKHIVGRPFGGEFWGDVYPAGYAAFVFTMKQNLDAYEARGEKFPFSPRIFGIRRSEVETAGAPYRNAVGDADFAKEEGPCLSDKRTRFQAFMASIKAAVVG